MRYEHFLAPARPAPWPGAVICLDCDIKWSKTDATDQREYAALERWTAKVVIRRGGDYAIAREATGKTAESFFDSLRAGSLRAANLWVISTRFREQAAALGLWERMESGQIRIDGKDARPATDRRGKRDKRRQGVCILEDPPIVVELRIAGGGCKVTWVDAANYGLSVAESSTSPRNEALDLARWFIKAAFTLQSLGECGWQSTAGSQAMHLYRAVYHETPILSHTEPRANTLESNALFGGRCEAYNIGRIGYRVHMYDFRALYPWICANRPVPCRLVGILENPEPQVLNSLVLSHCVCAEVRIETDEPDYPYQANDAVIYPVGRFSTCLIGDELNHAIAAGAVRSVRRAAYYETECALGRYARELYALRAAADNDSDTLQSSWIKRLMVALPGKFAQRQCGWEDMPDAECPWEWAEWYARSKSGEPERWRVLAGRIQRETRGGFTHGTVPAITAAVCATGRNRLLAAMRAAGREHVLYCDTDAVIVDDYGEEAITLAGWVRPGEWGWLQHVCTADSAEIYGTKHYRIGNRTRESGTRAGHSAADGGESSGLCQPPIRWGLRHQQAPADWRERTSGGHAHGEAGVIRPPGGRLDTPVIWEW